MRTSTTRRTVPYRRKREGKTNYKKRLELLKSRTNRLIIRKTNKHIILQVVEYQPDGDKVLVAISSKKLEGMGWKHSAKNIPAAYLTGVLLAQEAKKNKISSAILDLGLQTPIKGNKLYAALKGTIDGGLSVKASEEVFPVEERISGKHISAEVEKAFTTLKNTIMK